DDERGEPRGQRGQHQSGHQPGTLAQRERGHVAADAEERGVAERDHAGVSHQEIEAHREDAHDEDLLEELHRVVAGPEGKEGERDDYQREGGEPESRHFSGRPKSPCGRISTMPAITTYMMSIAASGSHAFPNVSA